MVIFRVKEIQTEVYVYVGGGGGGVVRMMGSTNLFQCKNEGQLLVDPIDSQFYRGNLGVLAISKRCSFQIELQSLLHLHL